MLRIITPAANTRLTTAASVRAQFGIPVAVLDATLEAWIDRVSAQIVSFCGRPFATEIVRQKFTRACYQDMLFLARTPVRSLTVTEDGTVLTVNTDYHVDEDSWAVLRIRDEYEEYWSSGVVQFDYTSGYILPDDEGERTLPHDVEHAAILLAGSLYAAESSASVGGGAVVKAEEIEGLGRIEYFVSTQSSDVNAPARLSHPTAELLLRPYVVPGFA